MLDLNQRHKDYESSALTAELMAYKLVGTEEFESSLERF